MSYREFETPNVLLQGWMRLPTVEGGKNRPSLLEMKQLRATSNRKADLRMRMRLLRHVECPSEEARNSYGVMDWLEDEGVVA